MARRQERPAIISDDIDRFIERMLLATAVVFVTTIVVIQLWRWVR